MKITKKGLKAIIREEIEAEFIRDEEEDEELDEANSMHDPNTGHFAAKKAGNTYSLTKTANVRDELKGRGEYKGEKADGTPKIGSKFGQNSGKDQCGRKDFSSHDEHNPRYHCKDYKKPYIREDALLEDEPGEQAGQDEYIHALVKQEVLKQLKQIKASSSSRKQLPCRPSLEDFIRFQALLAQAQNPPKK
jgi:hypothetical protein